MLISLTAPSHLLLAAWTAGVIWMIMRPQSSGARRLVIVPSLFLFLIVWGPMAGWLAAPLQNKYPAIDRATLEQAAALVQLSGAERPSLSSHRRDLRLNDQFGRYVEMRRLATLAPDTTIIFSGGYSTDTGSDIEIGAALYDTLGLKGRADFLGDADNTCGNAREVKRYLAAKGTQGPVALVTSAMHMPRSVLCFEAYGVRVIPAPAPPISQSRLTIRSWIASPIDTRRLRLLDLATHEWLGIAYYKLSGKINAFWPNDTQVP